MANHGDRIQRRPQPVCRRRCQCAKRRRLLLCGEGQPRLGQRFIETARARGDPPRVNADKGGRQNKRHPQANQIKVGIRRPQIIDRQGIIEEHKKTDTPRHKPNQLQGFTATKQCCRHHDRRQKKHGKGVQQAAGEIEKRR